MHSSKKLSFIFNFSFLLICILAFYFTKSYFYSKDIGSLGELKHTRADYIVSGGVWDKIYMKTDQKLSSNRLNLNTWGGFHEFELDKDLPNKNLKISIDSLISNSGYIYLYLRSSKQKSFGIRLSRNKDYPSISFIRDIDGAFEIKRSLDLDITDEENSIIIKLNNNLELLLNDKRIALDSFNYFKNIATVRLGLGGSYEQSPVSINKIEVLSEKDVIYSTRFSSLERKEGLKEAVFILILLFIYFLLMKKLKNKEVVLIVNLTLFFTLIGFYGVYHFYFSERYFDDGSLMDEKVGKKALELKAKYLSELQKDSKKVYFFGGSKTYGDGARLWQHTWVNRLINQSRKDISYFNFGIAGIGVKRIYEFVKVPFMKYRPDLVVLLIGVNDSNRDEFSEYSKMIIEENIKNKIPTLLLEEGSYINELKDLEQNNARKNFISIKYLCENEFVYCVEQSIELYGNNKLYDSGVRHVEWVHLNSYGQELFFNLVRPKFNELVNSL